MEHHSPLVVGRKKGDFMDHWYIDSKQYLLGSLDALLKDARGNAASLPTPSPEVAALLGAAERERAAIETLFDDLAARHATLTATVDDLQRALSVAGAPLRGEIS
jgi:hypothetical protein